MAGDKLDVDKYASMWTNSTEYSFDRQTDVHRYIDTQPVKLVYYIRLLKLTIHEFNKTNKQTNIIIERIRDAQVSDDNKYLCALCLRYLIINCSHGIDLSEHIRCRDIIDLIQVSYGNAGRLQNELVSVLDLIASSSNAHDSFQSPSDFESLLKNGVIDGHEKELIEQMVKRSQASTFGFNISENSTTKPNKFRQTTSRRTGTSQLVATKIIQTVKSSVKTGLKSEEEVGTRFLNLTTKAKNRNAKRDKMKVDEEKITTGIEENGTDQSNWRDTWSECVHLYNLARKDQTIKTKDKDEYLPSKLFGEHTIIISGFKELRLNCNILGIPTKVIFSFVINRICAATLCIVSKKQELNSNAIDKLMSCVVVWSDFQQLVAEKNDFFDHTVRLDHLEFLEELNGIKSDQIKVDFINDFFSKLKDINQTEIAKTSEGSILIRDFVKKLRLDAVNAILNSAQRNKYVLTAQRITKIQTCFKNLEHEKDAAFKEVLFKLTTLIAETTSGENHITIFENYMNFIRKKKSPQDVLHSVKFALGQSQDPKRCQELFTRQVVEDILKSITKNSDELSKDINQYAIETVQNYLKHDFSQDLSENSLCWLIQNIVSSADTGIFSLLLLCAGKNVTLCAQHNLLLLEMLKAPNPDDILQNYVIVILNQFSKNATTLNRTEELQLVSNYLKSEFMLPNDTIEFVKIDELVNQGGVPVSLLTAELMFSAITSGIKANDAITFNLLSTIVNSHQSKQAAIVAAKCIFNLSLTSQTQPWSTDLLGMIGNQMFSDIYDVEVYLKVSTKLKNLFCLISIFELQFFINYSILINLTTTKMLKLIGFRLLKQRFCLYPSLQID